MTMRRKEKRLEKAEERGDVEENKVEEEQEEVKKDICPWDFSCTGEKKSRSDGALSVFFTPLHLYHDTACWSLKW